MDEVLKLLAAGGVGAATIAAILYSAAENRLRSTFATRKDLDGVGGKVDGWSGLYTRFDSRVDEHERRIQELEITNRHEWKRISEQIESTANTLERVTSELREVSTQQIQLMAEWNAEARRRP